MKSTRYFFVRTCAIVILGGITGRDAHGQPFTIDWFTIDGGGGDSANGAFELSATIGQPDAGEVMTGGAFELTGGFWSVAAGPAPETAGDFDGDGDVDLSDFAVFAQCFGGANLPVSPGCPAGADADFDDDGDCDLGDFAVFAQNFTGP